MLHRFHGSRWAVGHHGHLADAEAEDEAHDQDLFLLCCQVSQCLAHPFRPIALNHNLIDRGRWISPLVAGAGVERLLRVAIACAQVIHDLVAGDREEPRGDLRPAVPAQSADSADSADERLLDDVVDIWTLGSDLHADESMHGVQVELQQRAECASIARPRSCDQAVVFIALRNVDSRWRLLLDTGSRGIGRNYPPDPL